MQVPLVELAESFSTVTSETSTRILVGMNLYYEDYVCIGEICKVEAALLHPNIEVGMYIEWPERILDLEIVT